MRFKMREKGVMSRTCFVVKEALVHLSEKYSISKSEAVLLLQKMLDKKWIESTNGEKKIRDNSSLFKIVSTSFLCSLS